MSAFESIDRLEGSKHEVGGLIIKKKVNADGEDTKFKRPSESLLGLKKLADEKRQQKREEEKAKRSLQHRSSYNEEEEADYSKKKKQKKDERHYRSYKPETPSHPGGVNEEAQARIKERYERSKDKGVYADSRDSSKKWKDNRDGRKDHKREEKRERKDERKSDRDRPDRKHDYERRGGGHSSTRRGYEQWEDTPSRSRRSEGSSERSTPRMKTPRGMGSCCVINEWG